MAHPSIIAPLPVALPLLGATVIAALRKWLSRAAADSLGLAFAFATLAAAIVLLVHSTHGTEVYWFGNWYPRGSMVLGISFVVNPVGAGLATLAAFLTTLALVFSWRFVDPGGNHFQSLMLVFLAAMCGFALTADLFNMFVFFELMSTAAFALCGLKIEEPAPLQGAFNFAVTNTIAAFLVLTGIAMLYAMTGALNMAQIGLAIGTRHDPPVLFAFSLLTCGFLIKAAIVPFHLWLPDAHAVAPTPVCVLFSGLMVELGLYAILRLHSVIFAAALIAHASRLRAILIVFGAITVLLGGIMCYAEHHVKRLLAYSTICHAGLMLLALAVQGPLAIAAMLTYLLAHALVKSGLFFVSGIMLLRLRTIGERDLFGRGVGLRWTALLWFLGAAGLAGAPPFCTMLGEAGVSFSAKLAGVHGLSLLFLFGGAITGAAVLRIGMHTFLGWGNLPLTDRAAEIGELPETKPEDRKIFWYQFTPAAICICGAVALTFIPGWQGILRSAASNIASQAAFLHTLYTGNSGLATQPSWHSEIPGAVVRGVLSLLLALMLALTSVFRLKLARAFRIGALLEGSMRPLRAMQSGHPGDYVVWADDWNRSIRQRHGFVPTLISIDHSLLMKNHNPAEYLESGIPTRLDRLPWSRWHLRVVSALAIAWLLDGLEGSLGGTLAGALKDPRTLGLTDAQIGLSSSFYLTGAVLGALIFGYLADRFGRRRLFTWTLLLYVCAAAATGLSWNLFSFTVFRVLTGAGIGGEYAAINSAVDEIVPARLRGRLDLLINGTFWVGIILGSIVSTLFLRPGVLGNQLGWRAAFFSGVPIGILVLWMRRYIPESPRWLIGHGQTAAAEDIVAAVEDEVYGTTQVPKSPVELVQIRTNHEPLLRRMKTILTTRPYRSRALLCLGLMAAQAFFYNSVFFSIGLVLLRYYGVPAEGIGFYFLPIAVANFLGPVMLGTMFDVVGRKTMIAGTYCASAAALLISSWCFSNEWLTLHSQIACWSLTFFFASTAASSAYLTVSEVFPQEVRASSIAFFYGFGTLAGGVGGPLIFGRLIGSGSREYLFRGYAIGAGLMFTAGIAQAIWGVAAERRSLEELAKRNSNESGRAASSFRVKCASHTSHVEESKEHLPARRSRFRLVR